MRAVRRASLGVVVAATMLTGGAAVAGSDPSAGTHDRPSGAVPFSEPQQLSESGGDDEFRLFGKQEPDEISFITVDGRVFTDEPPHFEAPGTVLLVAELSGKNEIGQDGTPGVGDPEGTGTANVQLILDPPEVCAQLEVSGIDLPAAAAHIHRGTKEVNGPVVVTLPTPGADGTADDCVTEGVTAALLEEIEADPAGFYVNVHTSAFPAGAVRGQLAEDPDAVTPSPGDRFVFREGLFELDDSDRNNPEPKGDQLGTVLAECTAVTVGEAPEDVSVVCSRVFTLDERGDIAVQESFTFADPLEDTLAVTGGTGDFRDAGGQVSFEVDPIEDTENFNSVYTFELTLSR